jgi:hypothetical protein
VLLFISFVLAGPVSECTRAFSSAELLDASDLAEVRFANQDPTGFEEAQAAVQERLACTGDPLSTLDVVRVQRVMALGAFFAGDEAAMRAAVGAMVTVDITARFPEEVVPRGHRLDRLLDELAGQPHGSGPALASFSDGWIEVNGAYAPNVDETVACTLQRLDNQGQVVETRYWQPGGDLGNWSSGGAVGDASAQAAARAAARAKRAKGALPQGTGPLKNDTSSEIARENAMARRVALVSATGAAAIASTVVYALAADAKSRALDPTELEPSALAYRDQANGLTWGWIGGSIVSGGLLATLVLVW